MLSTVFKMSDSDEDEIIINFEQQTEYFTKDDGNSAIRVKDRFELDHEPACVFKAGKSSKRIEFGHLEAGKTYKIASEEKIPNQKQHLQNALMMSMAVYEENSPTGYLERCSKYHTIKTVCAISINKE